MNGRKENKSQNLLKQRKQKLTDFTEMEEIADQNEITELTRNRSDGRWR